MEESQKDKLEWSEKAPLVLALAAQSYVLFNWYLATVDGIGYYADFVVAIAAGIALDLIVVTTTMGRREGRESKWSHAAAFGAFFCSALIALKVYGAASWLPEGWLHIAFPLEVWLYSQHLATPKRQSESQQSPLSIQPQEQPIVAPIVAPAPTALLESLVADIEPAAIIAPKKQQRVTSKRVERPASSGITKKSRVIAMLNEHGDLKDSELYDLLPDISQSSIRVHASEWRNQQREQVAATNGNGSH